MNICFICFKRNNSLDKLKDFDFLKNIVFRIYRKLEFLDFSVHTNMI